MLARISAVFSKRRIAVSRSFALLFVLLLLVTQSAQEGSMTSAALFLSGLTLVGIGTAGRLWCALYISGYKGNRLVTAGPYSITRNPLYLFSFTGFLGVGMATETFSIALVTGLVFALVYPSVILGEERYLQDQFGEAFSAYRRRTPRFWPDFRLFQEPESYTVNPRIFRRAIKDILWFVWIVGLIELVEALHETGLVKPLLTLP